MDEDVELLALSNEKVQEAQKEVDVKRLLSTRGIRPTNAFAGRDFAATSGLVKTEVHFIPTLFSLTLLKSHPLPKFDGLHVRTGAIGFGMLTPGARKDRGLPLWFVAGPDTAKFI